MQDMTFQGNWVKGIRDLSELFLTTACESIIISIKISIKNIEWVLSASQNGSFKGSFISKENKFLEMKSHFEIRANKHDNSFLILSSS